MAATVVRNEELQELSVQGQHLVTPWSPCSTAGSSAPRVTQSCEPRVDGAPLQPIPIVTIHNYSHLLALQAEEAAMEPRQREQCVRACTELCRH